MHAPNELIVGIVSRWSMLGIAPWGLVGCIVTLSPATVDRVDADEARVAPDASGQAMLGDAGTSDAGPVASAAITGNEWREATGNLAGVESSCGTFIHFAPVPHEARLLAGVVGHGLWSKDGAGEWTKLATHSDSAAIQNRAGFIVFDPDDDATFWESGNYGPCVYLTHDRGHSFVQLGDADHCDSLAVDFSDPDRKTLLAGGHENHKLWHSTDAGRTWSDIAARIENDGATSNVMLIGSDTLLVGTRLGTADGIYRSTDGGKSFEKVFTGGGFDSAPVRASDGTIFWLMIERTGSTRLLASHDEGITWTKVSQSEQQFRSIAFNLLELSDDRLIAFQGKRLLVSNDRGVRWSAVGPELAFDPWGIAYSPMLREVYAWHFTCDSGVNRVASDALVSLSFE